MKWLTVGGNTAGGIQVIGEVMGEGEGQGR